MPKKKRDLNFYRDDFKDDQDKRTHVLGCLHRNRKSILKHSLYRESDFEWQGKHWTLTLKGFEVGPTRI